MKKSADVEKEHTYEGLDPEALDYEPEAEKESVDQDETNKGVVSFTIDTKEEETNQHGNARGESGIEGGADERGEDLSGAEINHELNATFSDKEEKEDNLEEPASASLIIESKGQDGNKGGLKSTLGSKEDEVSKLEDKTELIASKEVDCGSVEDLKNLESTTVNEKVAREAAIKAAEESNKDLFNFSRLPVKVRGPLKLPRHAADMLSSGRPMSPNDELDFSPDSPIPPQSPPCALSDVSESDSELESLASECSTMTAVSELSMGDEDGGGDGPGKIKRRGMKKKRKDRRRLHGGKCSKEQHRLVNQIQMSFL